MSKIVVGIDASPASAAALAWAADQARRTGKSVLAVSVCQIHPVPPSSVPLPVTGHAGADPFREMHERELRLAIDAVDTEGVVVEELVPSGAPGRVLVEIAADADSLVLGGHGYRKGSAIVMGSVTSYCLRHASCPVVVVPLEGDRVDGPVVSRTAQEFR
ncbi:universal stress protein [Lentzea sp. NBRC 105346]|uniref:universal stress protein n=1 Tax=Lentzea sp. NBRC 105346 TaxID=3032205 RepID=UPI0024A17141|nr:universal stress protein [Lentzea sp. NBRC 105346]GLZ27934.1 universal stress protein [Lentzea sp. NBRC 105346]